MVQINQDLSAYEATTGYDPIPPGKYQVRITDSAVVQARSSGTDMLKITLTVTEGEFRGRKVFENFVLGHQVAMSRLKGLASAAGHPRPDFITDSDEFHGLQLIVSVKLEDGKDGYPPKNKVTAFLKQDGAKARPIPAPPAPREPAVAAPPPTETPKTMAAAGRPTMPWEK